MKSLFQALIVLVVFTSGCTTTQFNSSKVERENIATYSLPKKDLLLGFNATYKTTQKITVTKTTTVNIAGKDSIVKIENTTKPGQETYVPYSLKITDAQIAETLVSDNSERYRIITDKFSKNKGKKLQQSLTFYPNSNSIAAINGEAGTYTSEILQGIATGLQVIGKIVGSVLSGGTNLISSILPANKLEGSNQMKSLLQSKKAAKETKVKTREYVITYDSIATTTYTKGYAIPVKPTGTEPLLIKVSEGVLAPQTLQLTANVLTVQATSVKPSTEPSSFLYYREPAIVRYQLDLLDNTSKEPAKFIFSKTIAVPQLGTLKAIDTRVKGRNPAFVVEFDENGALKKYELNTDKNPAANTDAIQKIGDSAKELITDYKLQQLQNQYNYQKLQKDIEDLKKPSEEE
jgi:hypothetical protein